MSNNSSLAFHNGKFKIFVFSDVHDYLPGPDERVTLAISKILDDEKPDLVIMNGDISEGRADTEENFHEYIRRLTLPMEERGIPWCHTFGNHDAQYIHGPVLDKIVQQRIFQSFPHCISEDGPEDIPGVGNYVLPILSSDRSKVVYAVWALDSLSQMTDFEPFKDDKVPYRYKGVNINGNTGYDYIKFEQIAWYYHTSQAMEKQAGEKVRGLMFFHMALPEHRLVVGNPEETGMTGEYHEEICNAPLNSGMFAAILQRGDIDGVFVGHDHANDFTGRVCGVELGFEGSLSYKAYGLPKDGPKDPNYLRGGRIFVLDEEDPSNYNTYMRYNREFGIR